jgi:hypothetical protein
MLFEANNVMLKSKKLSIGEGLEIFCTIDKPKVETRYHSNKRGVNRKAL